MTSSQDDFMKRRAREQERWIRPNHNDFKTSQELKKAGWTGVRVNSLTDYVEYWFKGEVIADVPVSIHKADPEILNGKVREILG